MFFLTFGHPSYEALSEFTDAAASGSQARVASHLANCADCRAAVQALRTARTALRVTIDPLPNSLRDRVLASRASGLRIILPTSDVARRPARRWVFAAVAAAVVVASVLAEGLLSSSQNADAGDTSGSMSFSPAMPRPGQRVQVTYTAPTSLSRFPTLVLRARLRSVHGEAYQGGVPVHTVATLKRDRSGKYAASVVLPDSIVFAALAVEDSSGAIIDDYEKRTWELLTTLDGQRPSLAALDQRANDMMGRSFEQGHATTRRMVALYPDSIAGWSYLHAFETWMGVADVDSIRTKHRAALARLERPWRNASVVPGAVLGRLAWYSRTIDTASGSFWRARLMREAPSDGFALQWRLAGRLAVMHTDRDTSATFRMLDSLWEQRTPGRALQIAGVALNLATSTQRLDAIDLWWSRAQSITRDSVNSEMSFADQLSRVPTLRHLGADRMRRLLSKLDDPTAVSRYLTETTTQQETRVEARRRRVLASLGRALVDAGDTKAGLDTLKLAARTGWDLAIVRSMRTASFVAGDSATGWSMTARLVVDPSTSDSTRDSLDSVARRALGDARWAALRQEATRLFAQRVLEESKVQSLPRTARVQDAQGRTRTLRELGAGRVTVVVFWSRFCGWALDESESLNDVARRLEKVGAQLVLVIDDESGPSAALSAVLAEHKMTMPVHFDVNHSSSKALNNWGTPVYYVLDDGGRVRFKEVSTAGEALVRAEAVRLSNKVTGADKN